MQAWELYNLIWNTEYRKSGYDLDWKVLVFDDEKRVRLLFQPSSSKKDWFINIAGFFPIVRIINYLPILFTVGWKKVYDGCSDLIMEDLIRNINEHPDYDVEISGHSYGGAISVIAALDLYKRTKIKADVTTFGAPMPLFSIFSKLFAKLLLGNVTQYAHWNDVVTYCPPLIGYHNVTVKKLGSFSIKGLFDPYNYHLSYSDENLYK